MDLDFFEEVSEKSDWFVLRKQLLCKHIGDYKNSYKSLSSYDVVFVHVDNDGKPCLIKSHDNEAATYLIFTDVSLTRRVQGFNDLSAISELSGMDSDQIQTKHMMLGEFVRVVKESGKNSPVKVNAFKTKEFGFLCEEVLFTPVLDSFTGKSLMTDPAEAKALLAVDPNDEKRFGIEFTFYLITNQNAPENVDERQAYLKDKIEELAFVAPRIPMMKGSGTFLVVILNLENEIEEQAFIRDYKMFDEYSSVLFVTSSLRLLTGNLEQIHYNGEQIDTIFLPMIGWQKTLLNNK
jgi:hypothetical protein